MQQSFCVVWHPERDVLQKLWKYEVWTMPSVVLPGHVETVAHVMDSIGPSQQSLARKFQTGIGILRQQLDIV